MKKNMMRGAVALVVLLVLYILIAFLIPFERTATFWASFVFTLIAFAVAWFALHIAFVKHPDAKSRFYGFPIARIGVIYWVVQLVLGILFMGLAKWVPVWLAIVLYAIVLGVTVIGLVSAEAVVAEIHEQDDKLKKDVSAMRALQSMASSLAAQSNGSACGKELETLSEAFRYSDPVSNEMTCSLEQELEVHLNELQKALVDGDIGCVSVLCRKTQGVLRERNRLCKLNKVN